MDNVLLTDHLQSISPTSENRKNLYIIFVGFSDEQTTTIISFLRDKKFAPRGYTLNSLDELQNTLAQRSWDLILCTQQQDSFNPFEMTQKLNASEKDIPVLQLVSDLDLELIQQGLEQQVQAVLAIDNLDLLLIHIQREIAHLDNRREKRKLESQLAESQQRCKILMDHSSLAICFIHQQKIVYLNEAFAQQLGYQVKDLLIDKSVFSLLATQESDGLNTLLCEFASKGQNSQPYQVLAQRADNSHFTAHIILSRVHYNNNDCIEISMYQQRKRKDEENFNKLEPITGLYNRDSFNEALDTQIRQAHQGDNDCHLLYVNLTNFTDVKRLYGPHACRSLVRDIADIINDTFSQMHLKARVSDDTFCILYLEPLSEITYTIGCELFAKLNSYSNDFEGHPLTADTRVVVIPVTDTAPSVDKIYQRGQSTLLQLLSRDTNIVPEDYVLMFNIDNSATTDELQTVDAVKNAIAHNKLRLVYQPLVPLAFESNKEHYEVLLRMLGDKEEEIPPHQFLASVSHASLNEEMDRWVLKRSIDKFQTEREQNKSLRLFISVTDTVWEKQELLIWIAQNLRNSRIEADCIVIQISETEAATKLSEAKFFVDGLRQLNCLISLKHYGSTNYSRDILKLLNPDYVKLDGSYITELEENAALDNDFKLLLSNLKTLGVITIAPQVETPKVMSLLWKSGVCMIQGYYLQSPQEEMDYQF